MELLPPCFADAQLLKLSVFRFFLFNMFTIFPVSERGDVWLASRSSLRQIVDVITVWYQRSDPHLPRCLINDQQFCGTSSSALALARMRALTQGRTLWRMNLWILQKCFDKSKIAASLVQFSFFFVASDSTTYCLSSDPAVARSQIRPPFTQQVLGYNKHFVMFWKSSERAENK